MSVSESVSELPRWDLSELFPNAEGPEMSGAKERFSADLHRLGELFDQHDIRAAEPRSPTEDDLVAIDAVLVATNELFEQIRVLSSYLFGVVAANARNDQAAGELSAHQSRLASVSTLMTRFDAWVASLGADDLIAGSVVAAEHAHPLRRAAMGAEHQMGEGEEDLAAELALTGSSAWARLHGDITSRLLVDMPIQLARSNRSRWRRRGVWPPPPILSRARRPMTPSSRLGRR